MSKLLEQFRKRGLVENISDEVLGEILDKEKVTFYTGYDPTSKSLQIGNLFAIITMRRLQLAGHKPVLLVGGATGMIGDPSGKESERVLLSDEVVKANVEAQKKQLQKFLDFSGPAGAEMVNNYDWFKGMCLLEFLRDIGKRFRISDMLERDSVRARLDSETGISFTEFTYQMLQSYDFLHLSRAKDVRLQIGGSDQWGNITAGIDLVRKVDAKQVFGLVIPLVTDANGKKFGKSEGNTIYLDAEMTSPYQMYQYLLNSDDSSVVKYLKYFTFLSDEEILHYEKETKENPHKREAHRKLAETVTEYVHGKEGLAAALRATAIFFGEAIEKVSAKELASIFADVPSISISHDKLTQGMDISELLSLTPLFKSKGEARRSIEQNGASLNNKAITAVDYKVTSKDLVTENSLVLRKGKKNYCLVKLT
jgi:tyrosyl-tRNA synthetase